MTGGGVPLHCSVPSFSPVVGKPGLRRQGGTLYCFTGTSYGNDEDPRRGFAFPGVESSVGAAENSRLARPLCSDPVFMFTRGSCRFVCAPALEHHRAQLLVFLFLPEMHVQPRAPRAPARLTAARSPRPPAPSTGKPRGRERLSGGRSTGKRLGGLCGGFRRRDSAAGKGSWGARLGVKRQARARGREG